MAKRATGLSKHFKSKRSHKTKKRLAIKTTMLAKRKIKQKKKNKRHQ
jgi:hypothetical protein